MEWIESRRSHSPRVTGKLIMKKAQVTFNNMNQNDMSDIDFKASRGWLTKFLKTNGISFRRKSSAAQPDPEQMIAKLVSFVIQVRQLRKSTNTAPLI